MVGLGEHYIPAFALAIGMGEVLAGLVVSVPVLVGGLAQLASLIAMRWFKTNQRWIVVVVTIQGLAFVPLVAAAIQGSISAWWLFAVVSLYWGSGMAGGPAWNSWITQIVPQNIRSNFFARRTRVMQVATLVGFLTSGIVLYASNQNQMILWGYACIFLCAAISRWFSAAYLAFHVTPVRVESLMVTAPIVPNRESPTKVMASNGVDDARVGKRLILYLVAMQAFIQFSGPYFVPYIFKRLDASYPMFVALISMSIVAKIIALPLWGQVAQRYGRHGLMWIGGIGLIPLSSLWTFSDNLAWLMFVQILTGITWAAYELGFLLLFLSDIPQNKRAHLLTIFNFANSLAWCSGSLLGGWFLAQGDASYLTYHGLFYISSLGRLLCLGLLWNVERTRFSLMKRNRTNLLIQESTFIRSQGCENIQQDGQRRIA